MDRDPSPSRAREFILAQHGLLRLRIQDLLGATTRLRSGGAEPRELRILARDLLALLKAHIRDEERTLSRALADVDAFTRVGLRKIREEHQGQIRELGKMVKSLDASSEREVLAATIEEFARRIADDMDEEEREFLTEALLEDDTLVDTIVTGFIG